VGGGTAWYLGSLLAWGGATAAGLLFLYPAIRFAQHRNDTTARQLLRGSLLYVPLVYGLLVLDVCW